MATTERALHDYNSRGFRALAWAHRARMVDWKSVAFSECVGSATGCGVFCIAGRRPVVPPPVTGQLRSNWPYHFIVRSHSVELAARTSRSEERRVGKECR